MWKSLSTGKKAAVVLVALAFVAVLSDYLSSRKQTEPLRLSSGFFIQGQVLPQIDSIRITKGQEHVALRKKETQWVIESADGIPADAQKITDLLDRLQRAPVEVRGKVGEGDEATYGLAAAANPTKLEISAGDKPVTSLLIGKSPTSGGTFTVDQLTKKLVVAKEPLSVASRPGDWEYKVLVKVKSNSIKEIQFTPVVNGKGQKTLRVSRNKPEDPLVLADKVQGSEKPNDTAVKEFVRLIDQVTFDKLIPRTPELQKTLVDLGRTEVTLFSGTQYQVQVWSTAEVKNQPKHYYLEVKHGAAGTTPANQTEVEYEFPELNAAMVKWFFEVNSSQALSFTKRREDVVAKK